MKAGFTGLGALAVAAGLSTFGAAAFELPKVSVPEWFGGGANGESLAPGATADCPVIVNEDGSQMIRSPAGADSAAVHHQLSIKSTARECIVDGDHLTIRVGVEGDAMLGPVGAAGSYGGVVRVALRRTKDDSVVSSKTYRVNATIPSGAARADFRFLADPLIAPTVAKAQEDYEILVGFTDGAAAGEAPAHKKKKGRR
ncbi:hypothetical protein [Methylocystis iwaonis]|uniref:hypothetical protein n=1 Tax=Methylocystis iwaonis TaxID=2885079 RepID=UPI002E7B97E9|nr:hypothetical protein [Methylocystis iwaonis]